MLGHPKHARNLEIHSTIMHTSSLDLGFLSITLNVWGRREVEKVLRKKGARRAQDDSLGRRRLRFNRLIRRALSIHRKETMREGQDTGNG